VYLPAGGWYDWHTDEPLDGGRWVVAETPMERIPIYARAGAVIPMWPQAPPSTAGHHPDAVELHLFVPVADGTDRSFLQEDDGLTLAARDGARYRTTFEVSRRGGRVAVEASVEGDGYPEFAREAFHLVIHGASLERVVVGGEALAVRGGRAEIPNAGTGFAAEFDV
jgi:alpha-glucosidase